VTTSECEPLVEPRQPAEVVVQGANSATERACSTVPSGSAPAGGLDRHGRSESSGSSPATAHDSIVQLHETLNQLRVEMLSPTKAQQGECRPWAVNPCPGLACRGQVNVSPEGAEPRSPSQPERA
jgi:hypothetical protein